MTPDITGKNSNQNPQCYSGREMILLATELEKAGHALYRQAQKLAPTHQVAGIFKMMGQEELDHIKIINREIAPLFEKYESSWESDEVVAGYLKGRLDPDIFPDEKKLGEILRKIKTETQAIDLCLEGEYKSVSFYRDMISKLKICYGGECSSGIGAVEKILAEEEKHVEKLKKLREELAK